MVSPVLDEDLIKTLLRYAPTDDGLPPLQNGAMQALLDMYDRKMTRPEFIEHGSKCVVLYTQVSKLYMLRSIHQLYKDGALDDKAFSIALRDMEAMVRRLSEELIETLRQLQQCPSDEDKVH